MAVSAGLRRNAHRRNGADHQARTRGPLRQTPDIGGPLWVTHLCWIVGTVVLYFPCRWFARVKATRHEWWLSYL